MLVLYLFLQLHIDTLIDRFRANLVVYGGKPFSEDHWKTVRIGKLVFRVSLFVKNGLWVLYVELCFSKRELY